MIRDAVSLREDRAPDSFDETEDFPPGRPRGFDEVEALGPEAPLKSWIALLELERFISDSKKEVTKISSLL